MEYLIIILGLLILTYIYDYRRSSTGKLLWYVITFIALVALAGLRYRIGIDSIRYEGYYKEVPVLWELKYSYFAKVRWEPGFVVLLSACKSISKDFTLFQLVHAFIVNSAVFILFWKNSRNPFLGILLYCFYSYLALNTEVLREALAVALFLFAWPYFKRNNFLVYYLFILGAISMHIGAIVCLFCPIFVIPKVRYLFTFGKRTFVICAAILIVGFAINQLFFNYVKLLSFSATLVDRATAYAENDLGKSTYNIMGILGNIVKWILYPIIAMYFLNKEFSQMPDKKRSAFLHAEVLAMVSIYIAVLTIVINIFHRFNSYFIIFSILLVSDWVFSTLKVKAKRYRLNFIYWCLVLLPSFVFLLRAEFGPIGYGGRLKNYMTYYPYSSRLDPQEDRNREAVFRYYRTW